MRTIRLHDTRSGELHRAAPARPGPRRASTPAGRPSTTASTSATRRPFVVFALLKRFLEHEGYEVTLVANVTDVNDKIYDAARARRASRAPSWRAEMTAAYIADTDGLGPRPARPRAAGRARRSGPIIALIAALIDAGHAYAVDGRRLLPRAQRPALRRALPPRDRRHGPGRGRRGRRPQGGPARLRALEGAEARRGHRLGRALGPRAARAGTSSARRWPRSCSASASTSTAAATT